MKRLIRSHPASSSVFRNLLAALVLVLLYGAPAHAALALDASTPAGNSATAFVVSVGPFTPPNGSLLVALVMANSSGGAVTFTFSGTLANAAWTKREQTDPVAHSGGGGAAGVYTATGTGVATTESVTQNSTSQGIGMKILVFTGANTSTFGTTGFGTSTTQPATMATGKVLTTTVNNSWVMGAFSDFTGANTPTTTTNAPGFAWLSTGNVDGIAVWNAAVTATSGTNVDLNAQTTMAAQWNWAALEIIPTLGGGTVPRMPLLGVGP